MPNVKQTMTKLSIVSPIFHYIPKDRGGGVCEIPQVEEIKHSWCLR